jgi:hypothetical protein
MFWLAAGFAVPIIVAWRNGSSYGFAFSVLGVGVALYVITVTYMELKHRKHGLLMELTAGTGFIPKWVGALSLVGMGFAPSGGVIALLLWLDVFHVGKL